ncbi:MAG: stage II sporulation protein E [Deltaproteobacteria bacterium]
MQDKLEIYPYQRVGSFGERRPKKTAFSLNLGKIKLPALKKIDIISSLAGILTIDNLILAFCGWLMARAFVLGELLPFAYAWIGAFAVRQRGTSILLGLAALIGFAGVSQGESLWANIIAMGVLLLVMNFIRLPAARNWWAVPLLTLSSVFVSKTVLMLVTGLSFYEEMIIIFEAIIAGVLTFVFLVVADNIRQKKALNDFSFEDMAASLVLGVGVVMGLNDLHFMGISLASVVCRLGILLAALLWGSGGGTMVGLMVGIIPSISSSIFAQSLGLYAISGMLGGLFRNFGRLGVIIGFMLGNLALSMFISSTRATISGMWETGVAALIFMLLPETLTRKLPYQTIGVMKKTRGPGGEVMENGLKNTARQRIEHLAGVFDELSTSFTAATGKSTQVSRTGYLNYLYDELSRGYCQNCARYDMCWVRDSYTTSQEILDIFTMAETRGELRLDDCPPGFRRRCVNSRDLVAAINHMFDKLRINEYWSEKLEESRDLVSRQLQGVSQVIKNLAAEIDMEVGVDYDLRETLMHEFKRRGIKIRNLTPVRNSQQLILDIQADSCQDHHHCENEVASLVSGLLGERMEVCEKRCPRFPARSGCEFSMTRAFSYRVASGAAQVARDEVCGDSFTIATLREGKQLIALSDGMGVGTKACSESQAAVRLLENLLNSGFERELALKTINSILLLRSNEESFATLDMLVIDLFSGELDVIKVGAAPSFLKRGRQVGVISANSLPIGILEEVEMASEKRCLCPRDIVVMVSDGVLETSRQQADSGWLQDFLARVDENDPQVLAEMIMKKALAMCKGQPGDDMSVICMYIDLA